MNCKIIRDLGNPDLDKLKQEINLKIDTEVNDGDNVNEKMRIYNRVLKGAFEEMCPILDVTRVSRKGVQCEEIPYKNKYSKRRLAFGSQFYNSINSEVRCWKTNLFQKQLKTI